MLNSKSSHRRHCESEEVVVVVVIETQARGLAVLVAHFGVIGLGVEASIGIVLGEEVFCCMLPSNFSDAASELKVIVIIVVGNLFINVGAGASLLLFGQALLTKATTAAEAKACIVGCILSLVAHVEWPSVVEAYWLDFGVKVATILA